MNKSIQFKTYIIFFVLLSLLVLPSQKFYGQGVPMGFNYQAVVRNNLGLPIVNKSVKIKISIIKTNVSGQLVYEEDHDTKSNQFGIVNLIVGKGAKVGGTLAFANIPWGEDDFFVKVSLNADNSWINLGTAQLLSVPYALTSGNTQGLGNHGISNTEPIDNQVLRYNGSLEQWEPAVMSGSGSVTNVSASAPLSITGNASITPTISISPAGTAQSGYLLSSDWNFFNQKQNQLIAGSNIIISGNTISGATNTVNSANANGVSISGNTLIISTASGSSYGLLSPQDWTTFNSKLSQAPTILGLGNITVTGTYPLYSIAGSSTSVTNASANGVSISGNTLIISTASGTSYGLLSPQDWTTFNSKLSQAPTILGLGNITVTGTYPLYSIAGSSTSVTNANANGVSISGNTLIISTASGTSYGLLSPQDWNTFYNKQDLLVAGSNITINGNTISGTGAGLPIISLTPGVSIIGNLLSINNASGITNGLLTSTDWNAFNNKQNSIAGGSGISISGGNTVINTKPDQLVSLTGIGVVSITGTYPNFSINAPLFNLNSGTGISISGTNTVINTKPDQIVSLTGIGVVSVTGAYPNFSINAPQVNINSGANVTVTGTFPNYTISSSGGVAGSFDNGRVSTILGVITNFGNDLINTNLTLNDTDGNLLIYQFNLPLVKKIRPSTIIEIELNASTFLDDIKNGSVASFTVNIAAQNPTWGGVGFLSDNGKQNYTPLFMKGYYDNIGAGVSLNVSIYLKVIGSGGQIKIKDTTNILNDNNGGGYILIRETY